MNLNYRREDLPEQPHTMYHNLMPMPHVEWLDFPTDMSFEDYHERAFNYGIAHTEAHGRLLFDSAKVGKGEGYIVELGSYWNIGACYLGAGSKTVGRERVITIDIDRGHVFSLYSTQFYERPPTQLMRAFMNLIMMGVSDWVIPMRCSCIEAAEIIDIPIRVLSVDAGHDFLHASWDIVSFEPMLIPGAIVIFHDYEQEGVRKAVDKYVAESELFSEVTQVDEMTAYAVKR